ncbi:hypothetical protein F4861DRAFT_350756 [Xylaria intraflava]|nr:hypothetical protein F4861DRAFT_350756 [Xylaria intraflava]
MHASQARSGQAPKRYEKPLSVRRYRRYLQEPCHVPGLSRYSPCKFLYFGRSPQLLRSCLLTCTQRFGYLQYLICDRVSEQIAGLMPHVGALTRNIYIWRDWLSIAKRFNYRYLPMSIYLSIHPPPVIQTTKTDFGGRNAIYCDNATECLIGPRSAPAVVTPARRTNSNSQKRCAKRHLAPAGVLDKGIAPLASENCFVKTRLRDTYFLLNEQLKY